MSVALRTITRLQDADDINVTLGVGADEYALTWDNDTAKFVLRAPAAPFAGLLATGATTGATSQAQTFTNGIIGPSWKPAANSTTALQMQQADGTPIVTIDTTNKALGFYPGAKTFFVGPSAWINDDRLALRSMTSGRRTFLDLFTFDADGTDDLGVALFAKGTPTSLAAYEVLEFCYDATNVEFALDSIAGGTGTLRPIDIYASARGQLFLATTGNVGIGITSPATALHVVGAATITGGIRPAADSTTALQLQNAAGTSILNVDTTNSRVGIGTSAPVNTLDVNGYIGCTRIVAYGTQGDILRLDGTTIRLYAQAGGAVVTSASTGESLFSVSLIGLAVQNYFGAATNTVTNLYTINQRSSGTPDAGFGTGILYALNSSTTINQSAARIKTLWYEATHATRKADLVLTAYDTAEREGLRIRGNGSAPAIGFLGAQPQARIAHVADPAGGATVDAEARSVINSILTTLENFGFHATS